MEKKKRKLLIKPHPQEIKKLKNKIKAVFLKYKGQAPEILIKEVNPIIRSWANYYRHYVSSEVFSNLDHFLWHRSWRYANVATRKRIITGLQKNTLENKKVLLKINGGFIRLSEIINYFYYNLVTLK